MRWLIILHYPSLSPRLSVSSPDSDSPINWGMPVLRNLHAKQIQTSEGLNLEMGIPNLSLSSLSSLLVSMEHSQYLSRQVILLPCHIYSLELAVVLCFLFSDLVRRLNRKVTSNSWANTAVGSCPEHYGKAVGPPPVTRRGRLALKGHWLPNSKLTLRRLRCDGCLESTNADFTQEFVVFQGNHGLLWLLTFAVYWVSMV